MKKSIFIILLFSLNAFAQHTFFIKDASNKFDVKITVAKCDGQFCEGKINYSLFKKGQEKIIQQFSFENSSVWLGKDKKPQTNFSLMYDEQSVLHFEDFNFDGQKDLALNDGNFGGYGGPSYQVYLFSKSKNKFVHSKSFTNLSQGIGLGMFEVNSKQKMLFVDSKSGCCWHQTEGYKVIKNRPVKVYEQTRDATFNEVNPDKVKITTKRFVKGKWQTKVKYEKIEDDQ